MQASANTHTRTLNSHMFSKGRKKRKGKSRDYFHEKKWDISCPSEGGSDDNDFNILHHSSNKSVGMILLYHCSGSPLPRCYSPLPASHAHSGVHMKLSPRQSWLFPDFGFLSLLSSAPLLGLCLPGYQNLFYSAPVCCLFCTNTGYKNNLVLEINRF